MLGLEWLPLVVVCVVIGGLILVAPRAAAEGALELFGIVWSRRALKPETALRLAVGSGLVLIVVGTTVGLLMASPWR